MEIDKVSRKHIIDLHQSQLPGGPPATGTLVFDVMTKADLDIIVLAFQCHQTTPGLCRI